MNPRTKKLTIPMIIELGVWEASKHIDQYDVIEIEGISFNITGDAFTSDKFTYYMFVNSVCKLHDSGFDITKRLEEA
ncbi:hypothetical protein [Vibrio owensii]|uniref:Uncharacterized protein n=1 Tax=Vibrio owensii CAIM 1854 = LMG 25443 TaxID=1229493 RepID=A0A0C1ZAH9_9VIBR|nr:hypothetical protein [Vibrio owensii]KIF54090.1 hypothetical protein H735_06790 [Vibrio owensii CAIM 1854 = LMG 25443]